MIDQLSKGDLLGGKRIAVTGTIDINANVGAIGGLTSKASAVLQSGAKYFLVPTNQGEADIANARKVVGNAVEIIPVATLDEALAALQRIGGESVPPPAVAARDDRSRPLAEYRPRRSHPLPRHEAVTTTNRSVLWRRLSNFVAAHLLQPPMPAPK